MEPFEINTQDDTIAAISTPAGMGGIAVIRISGDKAIEIVNSAWKGADLTSAATHTLHLGKYYATDGKQLDEAVASIFREPTSFTGENVVEINIHGSLWIQKELLNDLVRRGARIANPGEFTQRAFINGKLDLARAEGVADLISASSKAAHDMAINQTKGLFSKELEKLREKLIDFASLLELELDFSEEDVEFAQRETLKKLCSDIITKINSLSDSYSQGSAIKKGVPVVIAGIPNAGKSSILNLLLREDKAIVTDIPGTTRDTIEGTREINGVLFRFIDTAGLRETTDKIEEIGVSRAISELKKAMIVVWVLDLTQEIEAQLNALEDFRKSHPEKSLILLRNKADLDQTETRSKGKLNLNTVIRNEGLKKDTVLDFSTVTKDGLVEFQDKLFEIATEGINTEKDIIVTNARHYETLTRASSALTRALEGLNQNLSPDFIAQDIREATSHLGSITGSITSTHLLHSIFSRFCIGK